MERIFESGENFYSMMPDTFPVVDGSITVELKSHMAAVFCYEAR